jgi:hypothetical protein
MFFNTPTRFPEAANQQDAARHLICGRAHRPLRVSGKTFEPTL